MLDDVLPTRVRGDWTAPDWLPPEAPLFMPEQVIERPRRRTWLRRLWRAAR